MIVFDPVAVDSEEVLLWLGGMARLAARGSRKRGAPMSVLSSNGSIGSVLIVLGATLFACLLAVCWLK